MCTYIASVYLDPQSNEHVGHDIQIGTRLFILEFVSIVIFSDLNPTGI